MRTPRRPGRRLPAAGALVLALAGASCFNASTPPPAVSSAPAAAGEVVAPGPVVKDEWHRVLISGQPAGYLRTTERARAGGGFSVTVYQKLIVRRGDVVLPTETSTRLDEDASGRVVGFAMRQGLSRDALEVTGRLDGDAFEVTEAIAGQAPRRSRLAAEHDAIGAHSFDVLVREKLAAPGDVVEARTFAPELRKFGVQRATYVADAPPPAGGAGPPLKQVTVTTELLPNIVTTQWLDARGDAQRSSLSALGHEIVMERSSAAEIARESFSSPPEIFFSTSVPIAGRVDAGAHAITYRLRSKSGELAFDPRRKPFPAAGTEETRPGTSTERWVRVRRVGPGTAPPGESATADLAEMLGSNAFIQSDDRAIIDAAAAAVGGEADPWRKAVALEKWVAGAITRKSMSTAFASATEVLAEREGDCTEHAVLLAALLRAAGLPSRVVAGLVEYQGSFVGHMWVEVHVNGWVPLDATRPQGSVGPDHIGLSVSSLHASSIVELFLDIVPIIGSASIEVVAIEN